MVQLFEGQLALVNPGLNFDPGDLVSCSKPFGQLTLGYLNLALNNPFMHMISCIG